jgi:hypothetical protein
MVRTEHREQATVASTWQCASGSVIGDELLEWPPDLFALTGTLLERSQIYRFLLSPHCGVNWPPTRIPGWARVVGEIASQWSRWVEHRRGAIPRLLKEEWNTLVERSQLPIEQLAKGEDWRACEALMTLHAIADEACAGLGVALGPRAGAACLYRARGRELLARTGSLARITPELLRVLPKVRTSPNGTSVCSFARYACLHHSGIDVRWHKIPVRHRGVDPRADHVTVLLLPWPLHIRETDFRPLPLDGSMPRMEQEPFGYFEFVPAEALDLDLLARTIVTARDEVGSVDGIVMPEGAIAASEIPALEVILDRYGVAFVIAGVRQSSQNVGKAQQLPSNWVHVGVNPRLEKGEPLPTVGHVQWHHLRQDKHHPWSLDEAQIYQYHLGGALHPSIRWGEAIHVPRRALQFLELGEDITIVSLVCEDLAQIDDVAEMVRSVGPTGMFALLLDGPQLSSRWAARYASVFADDPGSAVLTLTSFGLVDRSRPMGRDASRVIALWKARNRRAREIPLEVGAHGVVLTLCGRPARRGCADGRSPVQDAIDVFDVAVQQIRAPTATAAAPILATSDKPTPPALELGELTILTGWAQTLAETLAFEPERVSELLGDARAGAPWRAALGIAEPSARLCQAIDAAKQVLYAAASGRAPRLDRALIRAVGEPAAGETALVGLVRQVLRSLLEQAYYRRNTDEPDARTSEEAFMQPI